jgi:hypothetical protein
MSNGALPDRAKRRKTFKSQRGLLVHFTCVLSFEHVAIRPMLAAPLSARRGTARYRGSLTI